MGENHLFHFYFFEEFENVENREILRLNYRHIRDTSNPFDLPTEKFSKLFRLDKNSAFSLIEELAEFIDEPTRKDTVPFPLQVFASLQFFGHGSYQTIVGEDLNLGMSQPVVSRAINKVSTLISTYLLPRYVKFPSSDEDVRKAKNGFTNANLNFPNAIGTIDCTHVAIVSPKTDDPIHPAVAYINRKGFHSVNVQAIFDANLIITNINAQYPGATHDSAIWNVSRIHHHMRRKYVEGRRNCFLLGDSGYPIQPWMMTPFLNAQPNTPEGRYNIIHRQTRNVVERGFGILKARFRCLRKDRVLHYSHRIAARIICSCAVLHICRKNNLPNDFENENVDLVDDNLPDVEYVEIINNGDDLNEGQLIRRQVMNHIWEMFQ